MSYQVLARKFRPGTFAGLVGQDHVVRALTHALDNDRLHHAYLFTGTRGVGKTTIARILAKCLNCEHGVSSTPCGECSICREVNENRFVDLIEVDAASRTRVDDTRELLENAQYLPTRGRYKVYLIDEVHMLSASSFNALLKTLEEPPEHVKFLLATTDPKKVPVTVLSRCLQFQLKNIAPERTAAYLAEILDAEAVPYEPEALTVIGRAARGSMRDALSITDQAIGFGQGTLKLEAVVDMLGLVGRDEVGALVDALSSRDATNVLAVVAELAERSVDFETLLAELLSTLHAMAVTHAVGGDEPPPFDAETVQLLYQIALMGYRDLTITPDPRTGAEMTLLRMLCFAPDERGTRIAPLASTPTKDGTERASGQVSGTPAASDEGTEANGGQARALVHTPWHDLVDELDLSGVARMLAEHSVARRLDATRVELVLDPAHDMLLGEAQVQSIQRALSEHAGRPVKLVIEPGEPDVETPAARRARITAERQRAAESLLESDETVQSLLAEFGGRLDEVQPLEATGRAADDKRRTG
jgi:DNA polymerase-3 subunit gamma/tau